MPKRMEFARRADDSTGADKKKPGAVYRDEVQRKLDDFLGIAQNAKTEAKRIFALEEYKKKIKEATEEFKLVDFRGEKIHNFELQALKKIVEQINENYAEQRRKDKDFKVKDIEIDQIKVTIEDEKVVKIDLDDRNLTKIPKAVCELTNLQTLRLNNNQITVISGLDNLINLQNLEFNDNQITVISGLDNLTNLQTLWLRNNQIIKISGLDNLTSLQILELANNQITEISGLDNLTNLQTLWLERNQIIEISGLDSLINLQYFWLKGNQIKTADEKTQERIEALKSRKVFVSI